MLAVLKNLIIVRHFVQLPFTIQDMYTELVAREKFFVCKVCASFARAWIRITPLHVCNAYCMHCSTISNNNRAVNRAGRPCTNNLLQIDTKFVPNRPSAFLPDGRHISHFSQLWLTTTSDRNIHLPKTWYRFAPLIKFYRLIYNMSVFMTKNSRPQKNVA